eukprot:g6913.t1
MALTSLLPASAATPPSSCRSKPHQAESSQADAEFFEEVCNDLLEPLGVPPGSSTALRGFFEFQRAKQGTVLWEPGDPADFAFLLVTGHVDVLDEFCDRFGRQVESFVECSVPGQFTGELNLFTGESRKNKIVATEDLSMWTLTLDRFQRMRREALPLAFAFQSIALRYAAHRMHLSMLDGHVHTGLGKHNGSYQGNQLFTCPQGHGSFAKVEKVELGMSVQRAIAEKYFAAALPDAARKSTREETFDAMEYVDSKGREKSKSVELVGRYDIEQRQQRLEGFVEISLAEIVKAGMWEDSLEAMSHGPFSSSWEADQCLGVLGAQTFHLQSSYPRSQQHKSGRRPRSTQRAYFASHCLSKTWADLLALDGLGLFPHLEHLHLAQNGLEEGIPLELSSEVAESRHLPLPKLQSLVLDSNKISDWTALHLNNNLLGESIEGLAAAAADQTPRRLTGLFLNENKLASWRSIGALANYALLELKVQRIPLTDSGSPLASPMLLRQILIALMPTLLRLNASEVTVKERTAAERYFLSVAQLDNPIVKGLAESCKISEHVERLRAIHGNVARDPDKINFRYFGF